MVMVVVVVVVVVPGLVAVRIGVRVLEIWLGRRTHGAQG